MLLHAAKAGYRWYSIFYKVGAVPDESKNSGGEGRKVEVKGSHSAGSKTGLGWVYKQLGGEEG